MFKKCISLLLLLACTLSMTGCWDHLEISNMLIVAGIGLDIDEDNKVYYATVEVVDVAAQGNENIVATIVEGSGNTPYAAIQDAMTATGGTMFANHCKVMVVGDRLARQGINVIVDLILRSPNLRKSLEIMVAKDSTAKQILTGKTVKDDIISFELGTMLKSNADVLNITAPTNVYHLHEAFISSVPSGMAPVVAVKKNNKDEVLYVEGAAVFWQGKLQGYLDGEQSGLHNLIDHTVSSGILSVEDKALSDSPIEARITRNYLQLTPHIQGDALSMEVDIKVSATLQGLALLHVDLTDGQNVDRMQESFSKVLEQDIRQLIAQAQTDHGADIFGFHKEFEDKYRQEWPALSRDWQSHFRELEIIVNADVVIESSGMIGNYAPYDNEGNALP